ncbi:MAG: TonB-dependent receptor plug domain-containing protein [Gemmatimonas sp.]|nr:TonB-dependent receptor plug domain-containing protein [Gemmatimonas sp.]
MIIPLVRSRMLAASVVLAPLTVLLAPSLEAQGTVTGTVVQASTLEPISAVQLFIEGTEIGILSGPGGAFTISNVPVGTHVLVAQRIGFEPLRQEGVTVTQGQSTNLQLTMSTAALALQGVVVTGLVDPVQGVLSPIAVASVTREMMPVVQTGAAIQSLQGVVPGLQIVRPSGQPGEAPTMMLRTPTSIRSRSAPGENTFSGSNAGQLGTGAPLIVVDGVVLGGGGTPSTLDIEGMDVESIEVIRGAAASSQYGSRAAAGVIAITTARGQGIPLGQTRFSARTEMGVSQAVEGTYISRFHHYLMDPTNSYYVNAEGQEVPRDQRVTPPLHQSFLDRPFPGETYDNLGAVTRPGGFRSYNVGIQGNEVSTNFAISMNHNEEQGALVNNDGYTRSSFRINLDHRFQDNLSLGTSFFHSRDGRDEIFGGAGDVFEDAVLAPTDVDFGAKVDGQYVQQPDPTLLLQNPLWAQATRDAERRGTRTLASGRLTFSPASWISFVAGAGYDRSDRTTRELIPKGTPADVGSELGSSDGSLDIQDMLTDTYNADAQVSLRRDFGLLNVRTTVRGLVEHDREILSGRYGEGFTVEGVPHFSAIPPDRLEVLSWDTERNALGMLWDTALDYDTKYVLSGVLRRDGSSLFGPDNRWHNYYRIAGAWRVGEEPWFNIPNVSEFKLSLARGTAGGRPGQMWQYETWELQDGVPRPGTLGNRFLRPEHTVENELSLNAILYDRVGIVLTHARQRTTDQLIDAPQSTLTGYVDQWVNAGTLEGHSTEIQIEGQLIQEANFGWTSMLVGDYSYAEITEWPLPCRTNIAWRKFCEGEPVYGRFSLYVVHDTGERGGLEGELARHHGGKALPYIDEFMFNDEGMVVWVGEGNHYTEGVDKNLWGTTKEIEGVVYNWGAAFQERDEFGNPFRQLAGTGNPYSLGWINSFRLGANLTFSAHLHGSVGADAHNLATRNLINNRNSYIMDAGGKPVGLKKPISYYAASIVGNTNYYVERANYLKLRSLAVNYQMGQEQLARFGLGGMGMETLTLGLVGRNVFTVSTFSGFDPEGALNLATGVNSQTVPYPATRTLTASASVTF